MQPIPEAVAWSLRADAWAQKPDEPGEQSSGGALSRWSDVAATGVPALPADDAICQTRPSAVGAPYRALTSFASGWWMTMASVDCSGWSWNSSESSTPIRPGSRRSAILARSSRLGQAP